jgi:hypothetical protein
MSGDVQMVTGDGKVWKYTGKFPAWECIGRSYGNDAVFKNTFVEPRVNVQVRKDGLAGGECLKPYLGHCSPYCLLGCQDKGNEDLGEGEIIDVQTAPMRDFEKGEALEGKTFEDLTRELSEAAEEVKKEKERRKSKSGDAQMGETREYRKVVGMDKPSTDAMLNAKAAINEALGGHGSAGGESPIQGTRAGLVGVEHRTGFATGSYLCPRMEVGQQRLEEEAERRADIIYHKLGIAGQSGGKSTVKVGVRVVSEKKKSESLQTKREAVELEYHQDSHTRSSGLWSRDRKAHPSKDDESGGRRTE